MDIKDNFRDTTIVMDPVTEQADGSSSDNAVVQSRPSASKALYALCAVLAPLSGTVAGMCGAMAVGIANLLDYNMLNEHEKEVIYNWVADFTSENSRAVLM